MPAEEGVAQIAFKAWHIDDADDIWECVLGLVAMHTEGLQAFTQSYWFPPNDEYPDPDGYECHVLVIDKGRTRETIKPGDGMKVVRQGITVDVLTTEEFDARGYA